MSLLLLIGGGTPPPPVDLLDLGSIGDVSAIGDGPELDELNVDDLELPSIGDVSRIGSGPGLWEPIDGTFQPVGYDALNPIRLELLPSGDEHETPIELADSFARRWLTMRSDTGSLEFGLTNTDPAVAQITYRSLLRLIVDGVPRLLSTVEDDDRVLIDRSDDIGQITHIRGAGVVAEWTRAVVRPSTPLDSPLYDDQVRRFTWAAPELDITGFPRAVQQWRQDTDDPAFSAKHGMPLGWPDPEAYWIWSIAADETPPLHDPGRSPFWADITTTERTSYGLYVGCDDGWEGYIDAVPLGGDPRVNSWKEVVRVDFTLDPGIHRIAIMGENFDRLASTNTAGLIVDLYTLDDNGNDDELVLRSNRDWRCVHYPETLPGFTAGHIIRLLLEQAQADGELLGWTLLFDDINDANGNPWPVGQQITLPMGLDLLSVLRQLATTHIDFRMDQASRRLIATRIGELGSTTPVADLVDHLETLTSEERG